MIELLSIPIFAFLNRIRGGMLGDYLPIHGRIVATILLFPLTYILLPYPQAITFTLGYFLWSTLPLNRWDVLGRVPQWEYESQWEVIIEDIAEEFETRFTPLFVREFIGITPLTLTLVIQSGAWWKLSILPIYPTLSVALTEAAHHLNPGKFRKVSEPLVGGLWGVLLLLMAL